MTKQITFTIKEADKLSDFFASISLNKLIVLWVIQRINGYIPFRNKYFKVEGFN